MNICKLYSRHSWHIILEAINFWRRSHSRRLRTNAPNLQYHVSNFLSGLSGAL